METLAPIHPGLPFVGNALSLARDPLGLLAKLQRDYGRMVRLSIGGRRQYLLFRPEDARQVLQENNRNYIRSPAFLVLKRFLGEGMLTSDGDFWRKQRRLAQPAFHRQKIALLAETMVQEAAAWTAGLQRLDLSRPVDISQSFMDVTMQIVCRTLFSNDTEGRLGGLSHSLETLNKLGNSLLLSPVKFPENWPTPANLRFRRARAGVDSLIYDFIRTRKQTGQRRDDLLDTLLYATDEETGEGMSEEQLRNECVTLFAAGHETTAVSMAWLTYLLAQHPDVVAKLRAEADTVLGPDTGGCPPVAAFRQMPYSLQVVQEVMRLYPPVWIISRTPLTDDLFGDYRVPQGDTVLVSPYLLHRDPAHWPNPDRFDPDHFAEGRDKTRPAYTYLPFGGGPHLCIGNQFALLEMQILTTFLVRAFDIQLVDGETIRPRPLITLRPNRPIQVRLTSRFSGI